MQIRAGFEIAYDCPQPTPMLLVLSVHPSRLPDIASPHRIAFDPPIPARDYQDGFGNTCTRILAPAGRLVMSTEFTVRDPGTPDPVVPDAVQHPVEDLPDEVLVYLLGSRYCDTDRLSDTAWSLFGNVPPGWARVQAICGYVHDRITFGYEHADSTRTAWALFGNVPPGWARVQAICDYTHDRITFGYEHADPTRTAFGGHTDRLGVCRDFAHLAITLCRCMNIPARYCTGYLGDIGVPPVDAPMDFSAWFQAFLGGRWHTFDARHNVPRIGRILMATGRDATDVALATTFGPCTLVGFQVVTDEVAEG